MSDSLKNSYVAIHEPFYCRTVSLQMAFTQELDEKAHVIMYMEAFESDPLTGAWTVQEVNLDSKGKKIASYCPDSNRNIPFAKAMDKLSYFEGSRLYPLDADSGQYNIVSKPAEKMGYTHYLAYAEREGMILDTQHHLHLRPHAQAMPLDAEITKEALERADKNWDGTARTRHHSPLMVLDMDLSRLFASAANVKLDVEDVVDRKVERRIEVLDRFMIQLERCHKNQQAYVDEFRRLDKAHYIITANEALDEAERMIKKEFSKVDMPHSAQFLDFILKQRLYLIVLHAQGLQTLNNERIHSTRADNAPEKQYEINSKTINSRLIEAEKLFRRMNAPESDIENMKRFTLGKPPEASAVLTVLAKDYASKRDNYLKSVRDGKRLRSAAIIPTLIQTAAAAKAS